MHPMHITGMKLDQYLSQNQITDVAFAAKIGVASTTVMRWRRGLVRPDWSTIPKIGEATNGAVTANDFAAASNGNLPAVWSSQGAD